MTIRNITRKLMVLGCRSEKWHLTRFGLYSDLRSLDMKLENAKTASMSGSDYIAECLGVPKHKIEDFSYPEFNILNLEIPDSSYDLCVADQVLEHVEGDPRTAIKECARIVRPDGYILFATVMTYPIHFGPSDLWRFTPQGLKMLFACENIEIVHSGSWGGRLAVCLLAAGLGDLKVPVTKWHPVRKIANSKSEDFPVVVWCLGQKKRKL